MRKLRSFFPSGGMVDVEMTAVVKDRMTGFLKASFESSREIVVGKNVFDKLKNHNSIVLPQGMRLDVTNPSPNCRCLYCNRSWDPTKYETCPGCGAPQEEHTYPRGIWTVRVPDNEFFKG